VLAPRETQSRECRRLDGLWWFAFDASGTGRRTGWWRGRLPTTRQMPVPASFNDLVTDAAERDHVGDVWYQRDVFVPASWRGRRVVLRCDSATHRGTVWVEDKLVADHAGGYTPFEADITEWVEYGAPTRVTICVNNELSMATVPPGRIVHRADGVRVQRYFHDFYNYAGLHRSVWLYATPHTRVDDVTVVTRLDNATHTGRVEYRVDVSGAGATSVALYDAAGALVGAATGVVGAVIVPDVQPWRPGAPYLYRLEVQHGDDRYPVAVGIRTVRVDGTRLLLNDEPIELRGFGMHEDAALRGKGHDDVRMVRDFALLEWIGANSFRTSHYPYAEEVLDQADQRGILVVDETPAVGLHLSLGMMGTPGARTFVDGSVDTRTRQAHLAALRELVARDKNHPSVIAWSLANEPDSADPGARAYFEPIVAEARALDPTRPLCFANVAGAEPERDTLTDLFDVVCLNRYYGWYVDTADLVTARMHLTEELLAWQDKYAKPIIVTEFGVDTLPGLHTVPAELWSEEFQREYLAMSMDAFADVEAVVGAHIWNFADFATAQTIHRVGGNRKGVFTRDRQPKAAAHWLRERWRWRSAQGR
jgi:beta-glucuronidase